MATAGDDFTQRRTFRAESTNTPAKRSQSISKSGDVPSPGSENMDGSQHLVAKVVMLGDSGVGKSSLVMRYVDGHFTTSLKSTSCRGLKGKASDMGYRRTRKAPMFYRGAAAAIVVFDVTNEQSFEKLKGWVTELRQNTEDNLVIAIAANKIDMAEQRRVPPKRVIEYSETIRAAVFETSARLNTGVDELFASVAKQLIMVHRSIPTQPHSSSTHVETSEGGEEQSKCC